MENQQEPTTNKVSPALWVSIILIIIVLAVGAYFLFIQDNTTNTNNVNTTVNTNTTVNENVNTVSNDNSEVNTNVTTNINSTSNTNAITNTNTNMDTSEWETYISNDYGYSFKYPSEYDLRDLTVTNYSDILSKIGVGPTTIESGLIFYIQVYSSSVLTSNIIEDIQNKWGVSDNMVMSDDSFVVNGKKLTKDVTELERGNVWYIFELNGFTYEISYPIPHPTASEIPDIINTFSM